MRIYYSAGFKRTIDLDHVQEIGDLNYVCNPTIKKADKDGITYDSKPSGKASFYVRMAFKDDVVYYDLSFPERSLMHGEKMQDWSDHIVEKMERFKKAYDDLYAAWTSVDGTQPAFAVVRT